MNITTTLRKAQHHLTNHPNPTPLHTALHTTITHTLLRVTTTTTPTQLTTALAEVERSGVVDIARVLLGEEPRGIAGERVGHALVLSPSSASALVSSACECGWRGVSRRTPAAALRDHDEHVAVIPPASDSATEGETA